MKLIPKNVVTIKNFNDLNAVIKKLMNGSKIIFFDFDGVIKESNHIKAEAYKQLFSEFSEDIVKKIIKHHAENVGKSRYEKIKIYLQYCQLDCNIENLTKYEIAYSKLVVDKVIDAKFVHGILDYLKDNFKNQLFSIVSAVPQKEITKITSRIGISSMFDSINGSPDDKAQIIIRELTKHSISPSEALFIGDAWEDWQASLRVPIKFVYKVSN